MNKQITLSLEKARELYGKNPEMDELLLANFSKEELTKPIPPPKSWEDLGMVKGYYLFSNIDKITIKEANKGFFVTEKQAKSALAMAQLSQLMKAYNGDWFPNWCWTEQYKFTIVRYENKLVRKVHHSSWHFLAFQTEELRDEFYNNFQDLIKEYFEL